MTEPHNKIVKIKGIVVDPKNEHLHNVFALMPSKMLCIVSVAATHYEVYFYFFCIRTTGFKKFSITSLAH